ncbi:MAG TPA: SemiSWEET transporter [Rhodospirillales bacterium]|nr:SemiSWEET transporter [Rhodospirillales bacterium]
MDFSPASLIGVVAGLCSTSSFVPQVLKAWREGNTEAISKRMYIVTVSAFSLWIAYGVMIESWPIIAFNIASLVLSGGILVLKVRSSRRSINGASPAE